jgi:cytochrome b561
MSVGALDAFSLERARYSRVAMWFHWIIAVLIITNLALGFFHEGFGRSTGAAMMFWHKSLGLTVLLLSIGRLLWRLGHKPPPFDPHMARWEVAMARTAHAVFYILMIGLPLSGWLMISTAGRTTDFFGLFPVPPLPGIRSHDAHELLEEVHEYLGWTILALIVLHVAGAAKHHLEGQRHLIGRMASWIYRDR